MDLSSPTRNTTSVLCTSNTCRANLIAHGTLCIDIYIYIYVCEHIYIYMITHENTKLLQKIESHSGRYGKCVPMMQHQMINGGCQ